jgi:anti-sigma-K factor RskA
MSKQNDEFEQRVKTTLESSVSSLDAETRSRLVAGRVQALEHKPWQTRWLKLSGWIPTAALAACALLAVTLSIVNRHADSPLQVAQADPDFALEVLLGDEEDGPEAEADPNFYIQMEAMMLYEEDEQNAG